jgi:hypothetical protein
VATQEREQQRSGSEGAAEKAQELAAQAKEQAQGLQSRATEQVRGQIDERSTKIGEQISSFGQALRAAGEQLQQDENGSGADAARRAAQQVDRVAEYLRGSSSDRLLSDAERFARQRPWVAGGLGLAAGFVAARFLKASSEVRYDAADQARRDAYLPTTREAAETGRYGTIPRGV